MLADSHFFIGKSHTVCEDYALTGQTQIGKNNFVIVSDGCSSSEDTDFGSRILCKAAESAIQLLHSGESNLPMVRPLDHVSNMTNAIASNILESYGRMLTPYALDCTLLVAYQDTDAFHVIATGDGVIGARCNDGTIETYVIEYADNAPIYHNYLNNAKRLEGLKKTFDCTKRVYTITDDCEETRISQKVEEYFEFPFSRYSEVVIMTDGIESFHRLADDEQNYEPITPQNIVNNIMGYKTNHAGFVKRHCKDFMFDCSLLHMFNSDDVAMGALIR